MGSYPLELENKSSAEDTEHVEEKVGGFHQYREQGRKGRLGILGRLSHDSTACPSWLSS